MPARKPSGLITRADTKANRKKRRSAETAITPQAELSRRPPAELKGHQIACRTWGELIDLYNQTEIPIISAFDGSLLAKYCLADEELHTLLELRDQVMKLWKDHLRSLSRIKPGSKNLHDYFSALIQANALLQRYQGLDGRIDNKRKMLLAISQSLYLTPRSRAGVTPPLKKEPKPKSGLGKILDEE